MWSPVEEEDRTHCALCGRPLNAAPQEHHLIPKSKGGRETVPLHPICHHKIHRTFTNKELARRYNSIAALQAHPEMAKFIAWLQGRAPEFYKRMR